MVQITEDLVRKRSEHNEGEISTLEELSLHQEDIEKIEHLQQWCRDLRILYLQSNLIAKIENLHKMKRLEYLNMALNIIERIENLEGCEMLEKLDLTLNFIGELTSIETLRNNVHLTSLYLTGNPCAEYDGYRDYVIATLPQLQILDSETIERSHRILAVQNYEQLRSSIVAQQERYKGKREKQRMENLEKAAIKKDDETSGEDQENVNRFWNEMCDNSPETRIEIARQNQQQKLDKARQVGGVETEPSKRITRLFREDGSPLSVNEPRVPFTLLEDENENKLVLTVEVYRYLDTSLVKADVQPTYVRVDIKGKIFQLVLTEEVHPDRSCAQRSQTTGHLVISMPLVKDASQQKPFCAKVKHKTSSITVPQLNSKRELLEIGGPEKSMDFSKITAVKPKEFRPKLLGNNIKKRIEEKLPSDRFVENPDVPPLE